MLDAMDAEHCAGILFDTPILEYQARQQCDKVHLPKTEINIRPYVN
jgi:hypothetical protein